MKFKKPKRVWVNNSGLFQKYLLHKANKNPSYPLLLPMLYLIKTDLDIRGKGILEHFLFLN